MRSFSITVNKSSTLGVNCLASFGQILINFEIENYEVL